MEYAGVSLALSGLTALPVVGALGMPQVSQILIGRGRAVDARSAWPAKPLLIAGVGGLAVGWLLLTPWLGQLLLRVAAGQVLVSNRPSIAIACAALSVQLVAAESLRGAGQIREASLFSLPLVYLPFLMGLASLALQGRLTAASAMVAFAASTVLSGVLSIAVLRARTGRSVGIARDVMPSGRTWIVIWLSTILTMVGSQLDVWVLGTVATSGDVATFAAASRLAAVVAMPQHLVNSLAPPLLTTPGAVSKRSQSSLSRLTTLMAVVAGLMLVVYVVSGGRIMAAVFGMQFASAPAVLSILACARFTFVLTGPSGFSLVLRGREGVSLILTGLSAALTIAMGIAGYSYFGLAGFALGVFLAAAVQNIGEAVVARRSLDVRVHATIADVAGGVAELREWISSRLASYRGSS